VYAEAQSAYTAGRYASAIESCEEGLDADAESVELVSLMGVCHARQGNYDRAIACHRQLERLARERDDPHRLVEAVGNVGVMYYYKGEFPIAYDFMHRAGTMAAELNLLPLLAKTSNNIGFVLTKMERLTEADQAFEESIRIKLSLGAQSSLVAPYNGRGAIALAEGRYRDALEVYLKALQWARELDDCVNTGICLTNVGRCYFHMHDYDLAERRLTEASACLSETEFWNARSAAEERLAELYLHLDQPTEALACIDKRIELARRHKNRFMEAAGWEQKSRAYELADDRDMAMDCMRQSFRLQQCVGVYDRLSDDRGSVGDSPVRGLSVNVASVVQKVLT